MVQKSNRPTVADVRAMKARGQKISMLYVTTLEEAHPESLAFTLTIIKLDGCLDCETDSFRAMRGCVLCALQTLRRYRKDERELLKLYKESLKEVQAYLRPRTEPRPAPAPRGRAPMAVPA